MSIQPSPEPIVLDEFIAEDQLAMLLAQGDARRSGCLLRLRDGRLYALQEAARVLGNVRQETDPYGLTGSVDTLASLLRRGFVMNAERIALGRCVYDVEYGYLAQPVFGHADASGQNPVMR